MVSISSKTITVSESQNSIQNADATQKTSDDNIWSKYDDNKDGVINNTDTSVKPIYDQIMQKMETLSEKIKSTFNSAIEYLFEKGISYTQTLEGVKKADSSFEFSRQVVENRINLAVELNDIQPDSIGVHKKDPSIASVKKNGESVIIIPLKEGGGYITFRQNSQPLPENKKERVGYSEIERKDYKSLDELKKDMASENYNWGRMTLRQNHPDEIENQDLSLSRILIEYDSMVTLVGYDRFGK